MSPSKASTSRTGESAVSWLLKSALGISAGAFHEKRNVPSSCGESRSARRYMLQDAWASARTTGVHQARHFRARISPSTPLFPVPLDEKGRPEAALANKR